MAITAIWGPPCSGKTTLATDLAFAISKRGRSVCLVSPEPYSEMSAILNIRITDAQSIQAAQHLVGNLKQTVCQADGLLFVLAAASDADAFESEITGNDARSILTSADAAFDSVLVDCPPRADNTMAAWGLNLAQSVLLLTGFRNSAGFWHRAYSRAIQSFSDKALPICVQGNDGMDYRSLNRMIELVPRVWVPYYPAADNVRQMRRTLYDSGGKVGKTYNAAIDEICAAMKEG